MRDWKLTGKYFLFYRHAALFLSVLLALSTVGAAVGTLTAAAGNTLTAADSHVVYEDDFEGSELDSSKWVWAGQKERPEYTAEVANGSLLLHHADAGGSSVAGLRYVKDGERVEQRASVEFVSYAGLKPQLWVRVAQKWSNAYNSVSGYLVNFNCNAGGWIEVIIQKRNESYTTTNLASSRFSATDGSAYRLELVAQGTAPTLLVAYVYKITSSGERVVAVASATDNEACLQDAGTAGISYLRSSAVTDQTTVTVDHFEYTSTDDVAGRYYVQEGATGSKTFGQLVILDPTKQYILAAHAKDNGLRGGEDVNPLWIEYFNTGSSYTRALTSRTALKSNRTAEAAQAAGVEYNEYFTVFYDGFDLSACPDKKVESDLNGKTRVIVGFRCDGSTVTAGQFSHFTLYAADDPNKTNLLVNPDFKMGFYGWSDTADSYMSYTQMKESVCDSANGYVTLESVSEEAYQTLFSNLEYVEPQAPPKEYMLKNTGAGDDAKFGQIVEADLTAEYVYSVRFKAIMPNGSKPGVWVQNTQGEFVPIEENVIVYDELDTYQTSFRFKPAASDLAEKNGKAVLLVGYSSGMADGEVYYADFSLYRKDDSKQSNLLKNADFQSGLKGWTASYYAGFSAIEEETVTSVPDGCAALTEQTDSSFFQRTTLPDGKIVLHNNGQKAYGKIGNIVYLNPSKTYVYGVSYRYLDQKSCRPFLLYQNANGVLTNYDPDSVSLSVTADEKFYRNEYEFTIPAEAKIETDGTVKMKVGYTTGSTGADAYFGDFVLYEKDDSAKTNLLVNPDFQEGLKGWSDESSPITAADQYTLFGAELVAVSEDFFAIPTVEVLTGHWVIHNTGKVEYAKFGQIVELDPSKTYVYTASYRYEDQKGSMPFMQYFNGSSYVSATNYISVTQDETYYRESYEFKVPAEAAVQTNGKAKMKIGITCGMSGADAYFGDFLLYEKGDASQTNLLVNADFALGLYGWTSNGYNNLSITDYGVMQTKQGDVELVKVVDDFFKRPTTEKLTGHWVIHNTGKVEYAKFGQNVELDPSKTYVYTVSYRYEDQKGSMPFMRYDRGGSFVNSSDYISVTQDETYYRESYEFKVPTEATVQANGKVKMQIGITCGMSGADAYFGDFLLYEKGDASKTNLFVNADFALGLYGWTSNGYNGLPITDYGIMRTKQGDVELVEVASEYFKRPVFEKLTGHWVIHNTGKVEYAKFGQIVELDPSKTYVYTVSYRYEDQKGSMPFMLYFNGSSYVNYSNYISVTQDETYYRESYEFKVPAEAAVQANGKSRMKVGITCGMSGADAYFGDFLLYEKGDSSKSNLLINADFALGLYGWTSNGYNNLTISEYGIKQTKQGDVELVEAASDFFKRPAFEKFTQEPMLHVTGKWSYAHPGQIVELTPGETYYYSMYEKYLAQNGCKPLVFVKKNGSYTTFVKELDVVSQDVMNCFTVYQFTVPSDVDVNINGKSEVLVGLTTGITGSDAYFYHLELYRAKDPDKTNLFVNANFELGLYGWTGTSYNYKPETEFGITVFRYKQEAELLPYDAGVFINDSSDAFFDDGDWAKKFGKDYTMLDWLKKLGMSAGENVSVDQNQSFGGHNNGIVWPIAGGSVLVLSAAAVSTVLFAKRKRKR